MATLMVKMMISHLNLRGTEATPILDDKPTWTQKKTGLDRGFHSSNVAVEGFIFGWPDPFLGKLL